MLEQLEGLRAGLQKGPRRLGPPPGLGLRLGPLLGLGRRLGPLLGLGPRLGPVLGVGQRLLVCLSPLRWTRLYLRVGKGQQRRRAAPHLPLQLQRLRIEVRATSRVEQPRCKDA